MLQFEAFAFKANAYREIFTLAFSLASALTAMLAIASLTGKAG